MKHYTPRGQISKALYDRRWFIISWFLGLAFLSWFVGAFYSTFGQSQALTEQLKALPPELQAIAGMTDNFNTVPGYYGAQIFSKTIPMLMPVLGIMLGLSIASDEEEGTLQSLLALPVSRASVVIRRWLAATITLAVVIIGLGAGLFLSLWQQDLTLGTKVMLEALLNVWVLGTFFMTVTLAVAAIWGRKSWAIAVGSLLAVAGYLLQVMAAGAESLRPFEKLSPYFYYGADNALEVGVHYPHMGVLVASIAILLTIAITIFRRRNIAAA